MGGGGANPQLYRQKKKTIMNIGIYIEIYRHIFSGLKLNLHTYTINAVPLITYGMGYK